MNYKDYIRRKVAEYGSKFDPSDLDQRFVPFFENQKKVKVRTLGQTCTGTVGVTTGWKPVFLLMKHRNSSGSEITLGPSDLIIGE